MNTIPPTAPILTGPTPGMTINNATAITLSATSNGSRVTQMDFVLDPGGGETLLGSATIAPYTCQWSVYGISTGSHSVVARAWNGGQRTDSAPTVISIQPAVPAAISQKSGVVLYDDAQVSWNGHTDIKVAALVDQNPRWWRNYIPVLEGVPNPLPGGGYFLPTIPFPAMQTGRNPDYTPTPTAIANCLANAQGGYIATFAEPDGFGYSVAECIAGWHTIVTDPGVIAFRAAGGKLIGPYTVEDGSIANSYFRQFLAGIAANGDPDPDEYSLDKYAGSTLNSQNVSTIMQRVTNFHAAWPTKQLWLIEYAISDPNVTDATMTDFMQQMRAQIDPLSYVTADCWFYLGPHTGVPDFGSVRSASLYNDDGTIRVAGSVWKTLGR